MSSAQAKGSTGSGSSVSTKQVHPVILSSFAPTGCDLSTWAYITLPRPLSTSSSKSGSASSVGEENDSTNNHGDNDDLPTDLPNLVTAHANSLKIYVVDPMSGTLILASSYDNLAGIITTLHALPRAAGKSTSESYDGLLIGFAGQPRMSVVYPPGGFESTSAGAGGATENCWSGVLTASSIIDLTPPLIERSLGSVTPLEHDLLCSVTEDDKVPTVAVILGGGVSIAAFHLNRSSVGTTNATNTSDLASGWWRTASEPYFLPLSSLSTSLSVRKANLTSALNSKYAHKASSAALQQNVNKISHGFGDIVSSAFLHGYTEPVLAILHTNPHRYGGRPCAGRLGHHMAATRTPLCLTAISVSIVQKRSVVLWSLPDSTPADAFQLHPCKDGVLVLGVNEIVYVNSSGKVKCCTAVNGWVRSTGSPALLPQHGSVGGIMQPNPSPLTKLSIQLDGCRLSFVKENVAMLSLRDGSLYSLEIHDEKGCIGAGGGSGMCISLSPIGRKLTGVGSIASLSALPLVNIQTTKQPFRKFLDIGPTKKEEAFEDNTVVKEGETVEEMNSSLGLIFAGSRLGDSSLIMYGLNEKTKLVSLESDDDGEKAGNKRKREDIIKKEENENTSSMKKERTDSPDGKRSDTSIKGEQNNDHTAATVSDDDANLSEEEILRREEEALYAVSDSEDDEGDVSEQRNETLLPGISAKQLYRPQIRTISLFQHTKVIDKITGLGPVGSGCVGPTPTKEPKNAATIAASLTKENTGGSKVNIHPCGYGSSGGLAILTTPGLNAGSTVIDEVDCLNIDSVFPCPKLGYFFLSKKGEQQGCMILRMGKDGAESCLEEVEIESIVEQDGDGDIDFENSIPSFESTKDILTRMTIISVKEFSRRATSENYIILLVRYGSAFSLVIFAVENDKMSVTHSHFIGAHDEGALVQRDNLVSVSFVEHLDESRILAEGENLSLSCVWSTGCASIFSISCDNYDSWIVREVLLSKNIKELSMVSDLSDEGERFYSDGRIVAVDMFAVADNIFDHDSSSMKEGVGEKVQKVNGGARKAETNYRFDEDDLELYGEEEVDDLRIATESRPKEDTDTSHMAPSRYNTLGGYISGAELSTTSKVVVAVCRQTGELQMFDVTKLFSLCGESLVKQFTDDEASSNALLWNSKGGCGLGASILGSSANLSRRPKVHETCASEIRFFFSGPSNTISNDGADAKNLSILRSLCLLIETNQGDLQLYTGSKSHGRDDIAFKRVSLNSVSRPSKEEAKHRNKLKRKGTVKDSSTEQSSTFRGNRLHRFFSISGEDGLFAATSRPLWFLSERGAPAVLSHRLRHCAPAGGTEVPVAGFCSGFSSNNDESHSSYLIVHDRIGRVGSQRLTLFNGLSDVFTSHGLLPGGGLCIEKIPLGATVRQIQFIKDKSVSTPSHPVYALMVSREIQSDQSHLGDDTLSAEEKQAIKDERERKKMAKQVEADLGGFDIENEWVEEIEREECFEIEKRYGGCPPIPSSVYEIWIVDSSNWEILDTFQFDEFEHGMSMELMSLSDIPLDTDGSKQSEGNKTYDINSFLVVGTGIVDKDGEDVSSKGRIVLFEIKRIGDRTGKYEAELNFVYEKEMSLGPVTDITCLTAEGRSRLIVGAGAEITIEQWGNDKLTQVGFFHCYMQVQDILIFKNFLLLSDAYESLHFLVWRESDKSLTLLAKDYDPTSVYAAGLLSRGGTLSFVCHDDRQNLTFLNYAPNDVAARGGNKLVCRADCHLGTQTVAFQSHFCRSSLTVNSATLQSTLTALKQQDSLYGKADDSRRFGLHYGSTDGGYGTIIPVNENIYWRLVALQSVMSNALESDCSLSHRSWRLYRRSQRRGGCRNNDRKKGVVDGDLVMKYADLPLVEQEDLANAIGSTVDLILDNLLEVGVSSMVI